MFTDETEVGYKLRHKLTGLFYKPGSCKTNLSKTGKLYVKIKPPPKRIGRILYINSAQQKEYGLLVYEFRGNKTYSHQTKPEDWEVVEYRIIALEHYQPYIDIMSGERKVTL